MMLRKPTCADCPHNLQYTERLPIKKKGVTMHLGERFCVAGKRARKFKRSDPKTYVPSWCPRLKAPCELRIYGFKNQREWRMHRSMCAYLGEDISPSAFRYLLLQTCYRPRISKETPGVYRSQRLFAYSMQRWFRVFRAFALTDPPMYSAKPLFFLI